MSDSTATQRSTGARAVLLVDVPSPPSLPPSPCPLYEFAGLTLPPPPPARRSRAPTRRRAVAHKTIVLSSSPTKACLSLLCGPPSRVCPPLCLSPLSSFSPSSLSSFIPLCFPRARFHLLLLPPSSFLLHRCSHRIFFLAFSASAFSKFFSFVSCTAFSPLFSLFCCPCFLLLLLIFSLPLPFVLFGFLPTTFLCFRTVLPPCFLRFAAWPSPLRLRANLFRDERHSVAPFTVTRP